MQHMGRRSGEGGRRLRARIRGLAGQGARRHAMRAAAAAQPNVMPLSHRRACTGRKVDCFLPPSLAASLPSTCCSSPLFVHESRGCSRLYVSCRPRAAAAPLAPPPPPPMPLSAINCPFYFPSHQFIKFVKPCNAIKDLLA